MHIHFIGIGGISMSALAKICLHKGYVVSGSDFKDSDTVDMLRNQGISVFIGHKKQNITDDINLVVYTAAISDDNEELNQARLRNIRTLSRAEFLGEIMKEYKNPIAISGTHGKTSTTSMLSVIFQYSNLDPTILVGGNLKDIGGNVKIGNSENFITEACEYVDSFLNFNPKVSIVLNIEADHLDYFDGLDDVKDSFNKFGKILPNDGYFIINGDDVNCVDVLDGVDSNIIKYGKSSNNNMIIDNVSFDKLGHGSFSLSFDNKDLGKFKLCVPGLHNIYNGAAAICASLVSGIDVDTIRDNISKYKGVGRRFEYKGIYNKATIIDDYAHHPTEVKATLEAAKNMCKGNLWCVFQPHTYTRTSSLLDEFAASFNDASFVVITDIYAAREKNDGSIHSKDLVEKIKKYNENVIYIKEFDDIVNYLEYNVKAGDVVITTGAGNIYEVADKLI
ncbi:MAG: UDP-N-acetylmuramate--L-alanine ligase [Tepidibacter sp.]|jgi:UDP-N-acetylmuramate--alanine ligase|uniref:UDP-N-acetylmuramate--L-alanine ligase n=1 Tax=Tepidibacter sp. TaxID=2529387 RepID=UPI0025DA18CC|nr:UDP-N-acetylmuramate--L-alanine ligase [Tepidibacter sp.]MCT4508576.1 UDP-N-acetylmuramate--L-alanine ligase [Tepidibacter sp.]